MAAYVSTESSPQPDVAERRRTFRRFATGLFLFGLHALIIIFVLLLIFQH